MDKNQFLPSRRVYSLSNKNKNLPKFTFSLQIPRAFSSACKWSGFFIWIQLGLENEKEGVGGGVADGWARAYGTGTNFGIGPRLLGPCTFLPFLRLYPWVLPPSILNFFQFSRPCAYLYFFRGFFLWSF